ncbi:hsp70 protein [Ditylenchus destructor]|nr:hsp70 protein [Ditylenchus destructor]
MSDASSERPSTVLGIDLGTTFSCVGVWRDSDVEILEDSEGNRLTASCVSYSENGCVVGELALRKRVDNLQNTVYDMKRVLGKTYKQLIEQILTKYWPFRIIDNGEKLPVVELDFNGRKETKTPTMVSAAVLKKIRQTAELRLNKKVEHAVITVPAKFDQLQRTATMKAAKLAGLHVMELITEPAAAAFAFGYDSRKFHGYKILVFDLGGGTLDVTIVKVVSSHFTVRGVEGDMNLGGRDFDNILFEICNKKIMDQHGIDCNASPMLKQMLLIQCEALKRNLSDRDSFWLDLHEVFGMDAYKCKIVTVSREEFETHCCHLLKRAEDTVLRVLRETSMQPKDLDVIVLVGGSSRLPMVRKLLREIFPDKVLNVSMNPDEAIARGAALRAAQLSKHEEDNKLNLMKLTEVTPLSLGIGTGVDSEDFVPIIERNSLVPMKRTELFTNSKNHKRQMTFRIFEGEHKITRNNRFLGQLKLHYHKPSLGKAGSARIALSMELDRNGILTVTARLGDQIKSLDIDYNKEKTSDQNIEAKLISSANAELEGKEYNRRRAKNALAMAIEKVKFDLTKRAKLSRNQKIVDQKCKRFREWLKDNPDATEAEFKHKLEAFNKNPRKRKRSDSDIDPTTSESEESDHEDDYIYYNGIYKEPDESSSERKLKYKYT